MPATNPLTAIPQRRIKLISRVHTTDSAVKPSKKAVTPQACVIKLPLRVSSLFRMKFAQMSLLRKNPGM